MNSNELIRGELLRVLENKAKVIPDYTQKELAREIGMQPSVLSEILNGRRKAGPRTAEKFRPLFSPSCWQRIGKQLSIESRLVKMYRKDVDFPEMNQDQIRFTEDPIYNKITVLIRAGVFPTDYSSMSQRLGFPIERIKEAVGILVNLGIVTGREGALVHTGVDIKFTDQKTNDALLRRRKLLAKEISNSTLCDPSETYFHEWMASINPEDLPELKKAIIKTIEKFKNKANRSRPERLYTLFISLFPFDRPEKTRTQ